MARGSKKCPNCGTATGPRSFKCSECNYAFEFKDPSVHAIRKKLDGTKAVKCDWRQLVRGDRIRVIQGSGPYFQPKEEGSEKIQMGYAGKFTVLFITKEAIHAIGNKKESGHCVIYMGESTFNEETGIQREPHKIIKLKPRKIE